MDVSMFRVCTLAYLSQVALPMLEVGEIEESVQHWKG
jgi:hypothetical protein